MSDSKKQSQNGRQPKATFAAIRYYVRSMWNYKPYTLGWIVSVPLTVFVNNYAPQLILATVLNKLTHPATYKHDVWASFEPNVIWYAILLFSGIFLWRLVDFCMWYLEQHIQQDIAEDVFRHMMRRSTDFHANNFSGSLVSQTNKLTGGYVRFQDTTIFQAYPMFAGIIIVTAILSTKAPLFAVGLIGFITMYLLIAIVLARPIHKHLARFAAAESRQTGLLADAISNVGVIKSFAHGRYENNRFHKATEDSKRHLQGFARAHQFQMLTLGSMSRLISSFALVAAIIAVTRYNANIATVFLIVSYTTTIVEQLFQFSNNSLRTYNRVLGDAKEMTTILAQAIEIQDPEPAEKSQMNHGAIDFKDVVFSHSGAQDALFNAFNLHIKPGEKIGLVGHSGSGKTTFTRLLLRFSDIQNGTILIDGQSIAAVTQDDLHQAIAYVPQEPLLFHRTIRENIAYGQIDADDKAIQRAARLAHAAEFIDQLPLGYETLVGERGVKLSGGQRQRIAIARAMLKDAPILLLDEATSALDSESEVLIQDALWKLMEDKTAIVIAHRLSTIQKMDRIIVLDEGAIAEQGSHQELLQANGSYAKLWTHQSGGFIDD